MAVLSYLDSETSQRVPMTREQSDYFLKCFALDRSQPDKLFDEQMAKELGTGGQIMWLRLAWQPPGVEPVKVTPRRR